jgi:hypothetical protein
MKLRGVPNHVQDFLAVLLNPIMLLFGYISLCKMVYIEGPHC